MLEPRTRCSPSGRRRSVATGGPGTAQHVEGALEQLRAVTRRLRAHFDVVPVLELRGDTRLRVGSVVRLWGVHPKGARALPGCPKSRAIFSDLEPVAAYALGGDPSMQIALDPLRPALYESRVVPGADEIALAIRITPRADHGAAAARAAEERYLKLVRARLRELGVSER